MSRRMRMIVAAMAMATVLLAERDAHAIFFPVTCGTPTSACGITTCTDLLGWTCTTTGTGSFSNCVNGFGGCIFSSYECTGTYPGGNS